MVNSVEYYTPWPRWNIGLGKKMQFSVEKKFHVRVYVSLATEQRSLVESCRVYATQMVSKLFFQG